MVQDIGICFAPCDRVMSSFSMPNFIIVSLGIHPKQMH